MKSPDSFVPLTAAPVPPAPREFRVAILSGDHHHANGNGSGNGHGDGVVAPGAFQAMESRRPAAVGSANGTEKKIGEPRVTVQRDGDRVTHLRIQCTCGQIMELACVYDVPAPTA